MTRLLGTVRAYLELSRVSNLPTCWTNVLVGCAVGGMAQGGQSFGFSWLIVVIVAIAISLMYVGGMALNDACDAAIDSRERPDRPIPSGRITRRAASVYAGWCLGLGLGALTFVGMPAAVIGAILVACIIAYDALHQRFAASVILMGGCRGLVYLVAAAAIAWPLDIMTSATVAVSMTWYVIILSIIARHEMTEGAPVRRRLLTASMLLALVVPALVRRLGGSISDPGAATEWWWVGMGLAAAGWMLWSARHVLIPRPIAFRAVLGWLSGICLVDAFYLTLLAPQVSGDWAMLVAISIGCFLLTLLGHRRILGT